MQWGTLNGYVLALASLTLIGGALADAHGKARVLAIGCVIFAAGSVACALAPSAAWLIVARVAQGIGAALLTPASLALIGATLPPKASATAAIGVWAAASALTTAGGPVLGGWLTETFGWQAVFWINPALAVVAVGLLLWIAGARGSTRAAPVLDLIGAAIIAAALEALAWALSQIGRSEAVSAASAMSNAAIVGVGALGAADQRLRILGAHQRASDDAAAAGKESGLCRLNA